MEIIENIQQLHKQILSQIKEIDELPKTLNILKQNTSEVDLLIKFDISYFILSKLSSLVKILFNSQNDLVLISNVVRYSLEALITTRLLIKENDYFLKIYFSNYFNKERKGNSFIKRAQYEITIFEKLETEEKRLLSEIDFDKIKEIKITDIFDKVDVNLEQNTFMFDDDVKNNGYSFQAYLIENKIIKYFKEQIDFVKKSKDEKARELYKCEFINKLYPNINQYTELFNLTKESRPWQKKAIDVNLGHEYETIYELTSSLMHFTAYSFFTVKDIHDEEIRLYLKFISQYLKHIIVNIKAFINVK